MTKFLFGIVGILSAATIALGWYVLWFLGLITFWVHYTVIYM